MELKELELSLQKLVQKIVDYLSKEKIIFMEGPSYKEFSFRVSIYDKDILQSILNSLVEIDLLERHVEMGSSLAYTLNEEKCKKKEDYLQNPRKILKTLLRKKF
ncbi:MAG: hypothetical protein QMD14_04035 [Candidatus Aenigmarchaeota archaeon]|nr:hypothetical protein [Candidatus Aenigmarchaeota archaeon]